MITHNVNTLLNEHVILDIDGVIPHTILKESSGFEPN